MLWLLPYDTDTATRLQKLDKTVCISLCSNTLGNSMILTVLPPAVG